MIDDKRIGNRDNPPEVTVTGGTIPTAATRVNIGSGFFVALDANINSTHPAVSECRVIVQQHVMGNQKPTEADHEEPDTNNEEIEGGEDES